ncbi:MAG TPA: amidohydrolase family protein [Solirubrobacteraceae bacterium]|nr:amidohydrolase family protein [Solirubrobacteraceae bacterium]
MPIALGHFDPVLRPLLLSGREGLGDVEWFDAHTHIGQNDPDGLRATPEEILGGLDEAGHARALLFPMHEPGGYREANDAVLAACTASGGRFVALGRVSPHAEDAVAEAERCLLAGARGIKLHPRSDAFGLPHPVVGKTAALVAEHDGVLLFHAGRGIPHLGESVVDLAREFPRAQIVLAHAGISDLGRIAPAAAELPNVRFDTSWWQVSDLLQLYATIPPGQILYGSDMPYGAGLLTSFLFLRLASAVGLEARALRGIAGEQLGRIVAGEPAADLGPAPGTEALGERVLEAERAAAYTSIAAQLAYRGLDPSEALSLAVFACQRTSDDGPAELLDAVAGLCRLGLDAVSRRPDRPRAAAPPALAAMALAGTPHAGVPAVLV